MMILSKKKYVEPSNVLNSMVDDYGKILLFQNRKKLKKGKIIPIGDQKDINEFNLNFLARIEEGLLQQDCNKSQIQNEEESKSEAKPPSETSKLLSPEKQSQKQFIMSNEDHMVFKLFFGKAHRYMTYIEDGQKVRFIG